MAQSNKKAPAKKTAAKKAAPKKSTAKKAPAKKTAAKKAPAKKAPAKKAAAKDGTQVVERHENAHVEALEAIKVDLLSSDDFIKWAEQEVTEEVEEALSSVPDTITIDLKAGKGWIRRFFSRLIPRRKK